MDNSEFIKTIKVINTNLNDIEFTIEVDEEYLQKDEKFICLESGMQFIVVARPYRNSQGKPEIRCKLPTEINSLRYDGHIKEGLYEPGTITYIGNIDNEREQI